MERPFFCRGVTLIELMVGLAVLAILLTAGQAFVGNMIDRGRLTGAAAAVRDHLHFSRSEAIKQVRSITVTHPSGNGVDWRLGAHDDGTCDPAEESSGSPGACTVLVGDERVTAIVDGSAFPGISAQASRPATRFDQINGTALGTNATVTVRSPAGREIRVITSNIGRIRTCSPAGEAHVPGYAQC